VTCSKVKFTESFRPYYGPGVDSASNRNGYRGYLLRPVRTADNLGNHHVLIVLKCGSLNLLESSERVIIGL